MFLSDFEEDELTLKIEPYPMEVLIDFEPVFRSCASEREKEREREKGRRRMASTPPTLASLSAMDLSAPEQLQPTQTGNAGTSTSGSSSVAFKIVLLGEGRVGKTSLLLRFTKTAAFDERQVPTIQAAFLKRTVRVDAMGKYANAELNIWDTAGQVRTQALPHIYTFMYMYIFVKRKCSRDMRVISLSHSLSFASRRADTSFRASTRVSTYMHMHMVSHIHCTSLTFSPMDTWMSLHLHVCDTFIYILQERFHALGPIYYRDADAALLVFDIAGADALIHTFRERWVMQSEGMVYIHMKRERMSQGPLVVADRCLMVFVSRLFRQSGVLF